MYVHYRVKQKQTEKCVHIFQSLFHNNSGNHVDAELETTVVDSYSPKISL